MTAPGSHQRLNATAASGWQAELNLGFKRSGLRTVLATRQQRGPLSMQRPFYPEGDVCHAYVLHPPGGVVGGDELALHCTVGEQASALLTTPGATKFYRSDAKLAQQQQHFLVSDGCMEWLPQENIFFPGAHCTLGTRIELDATAQYIGWEIHCLGRPAIGERFDRGRVEFKTMLLREQKPLFIDRLRVYGHPAYGQGDLDGAAGLRGQPVIATMIATPAGQTVLETARPLCDVNLQYGDAGATLMNDVLLIRYLGSNTAEAHKLLRSIWREIRPLINNRAAISPRIWAT